MSLRSHIPNGVTSANLLSGLAGVILSFEGRLEAAFVAMLAAAVFDFCDGLTARALKAFSPLGKDLDSLSDMVSFGALPALMMVCTARLGGGGWWAFIPLLFAVGAALRLAKFNVDTRQGTDFIGLPSPSAAILAGALCALTAVSPDGSFLSRMAGEGYFLPVIAVVLALLMVSEIPMFGMKIAPGHKLLDVPRTVFLCLGVVAAVAVLILKARWTLFPLLLFSIYLIENLILALLRPRS